MSNPLLVPLIITAAILLAVVILSISLLRVNVLIAKSMSRVAANQGIIEKGGLSGLQSSSLERSLSPIERVIFRLAIFFFKGVK